jgi:transcriptional regulator with XRE-family HTH domain
MLTSNEVNQAPSQGNWQESNRDTNILIGKRIRRERTLQALTQKELGEMAGITFQQIQKYESAVVNIYAHTLKRIAAALNRPVGYFYGET